MAKQQKDKQELPQPKLLVSREEAKRSLIDRISKAKELLNIKISTEAQLKEERAKYYKWNDFNTQLLSKIFSNPNESENYSYWSGISVIGPPNLMEDIEEHFNDIKDKIFKLESIIERLELYDETKQSSETRFNVFYKNFLKTGNILNISEAQLQQVLNGYKKKTSFSVKGEQYTFSDISVLKIYTYDTFKDHERNMVMLQSERIHTQPYEPYFSKQTLLSLGKDVSEEYLDKIDIERLSATKTNAELNQEQSMNFDYAIIAALYSDELKFIEPFIEYVDTVESDTKKLIKYGTLKGSDKKVIYASLQSTGMVDAAIVTTDLIVRYSPKYVFMIGVCGGKDSEKVMLGDIVVAKKVFTFQKGKETNEGFLPEVDSIEMDGKVIQIIETSKDKIVSEMNANGTNVQNVHIEPVACSISVIDKNGYFKENVSAVDRKTIALEMESYGVARACSIANNGNTKAIIIKGVMDKTTQKDDAMKAVAGKNSAIFLKNLLLGKYLEK